MASTSDGSCRFASSDGSNLSSFSISGALGAVPRVVRERYSLELVPLERVAFELAACELVFEFEVRERGFCELALREPEDLELPPDLLCAIPLATIPPPDPARAACRHGGAN
jgi:hypothetical protein